MKKIVCLLILFALILTGCAPDVIQADTTDAVALPVSTEKITTTEEEKVVKSEFPVQKIKIAGIDISKYKIIYAGSTDSAERTAVSAFRDYIKLATGISVSRSTDVTEHEYEIVIGHTARDNGKINTIRKTLGTDGYAIVYDSGRLYITGSSTRGTLYGVYSFLEDYVGCRFYSSSFDYVVESDLVDIPADINISYVPRLQYRDAYWFDMFNAQFAAKHKVNSCVSRNLSAVGGGVSYAGNFVHTLAALSETTPKVDVQPCLTDPDVYKTVLKNVKAWLRANPDARIISVSQNDSTDAGRGCQCKNCKAIDKAEGTPMGSLLTFVNKIANDIKDEFPGVYVDTLAYRYTRTAPKTIKPADNVIIRLCSIECCFSHTFTECDTSGFVSDLEAWSKICKNLYIWDYTTNFLYYINPFPNLHVLYDNMQFFIKNNVIGIFEQGNYQSISGEFGELRAYLLAKLLWNPDMSREEYYAYMDDFLKGYYGDGWQYIREYIDKTSAEAAEGHIGIYYKIDDIFNMKRVSGKYDMAFIEEMAELWAKAYDAADDIHKPNVEKSSLQIKYASLYLSWNASSPDELEELYNNMKKYGITHFREGALLPELKSFKNKLSTW